MYPCNRQTEGMSYIGEGLTMAAPAGIEFNKPCCFRTIDSRIEIVSVENRQFIVGIVQRDRLFRGWSLPKETENNQKGQVHIFMHEERFHRSGIIKKSWSRKRWMKIKNMLRNRFIEKNQRRVLEITVLHRNISFRSYWPVKLGLRFSKNAVMPSLRSACQHKKKHQTSDLHIFRFTYQAEGRMKDTFFESISFCQCCFES